MSWTREEPAPGVVIWQPKRGFRYGSEAFWLVGFALEGGVPSTALDLGTGSGIGALLLAARGIAATGIDVRSEWSEGWARSLADSRVAADLRVADVREWTGLADLVVSNPPYFPAGTGPRAPDPWKAAARTESGATLDDFVAAATRCSRRACFVIPAERAIRAPGWRIARRVRVGRTRALVEIAPGEGTDAVFDHIAEADPRATRWYDLARGAVIQFRPEGPPG